MFDKEWTKRSYPFFRKYEALINEYRVKIDMVNGKLQLVDLAYNYKEDPQYYVYLEGLDDSVESKP